MSPGPCSTPPSRSGTNRPGAGPSSCSATTSSRPRSASSPCCRSPRGGRAAASTPPKCCCPPERGGCRKPRWSSRTRSGRSRRDDSRQPWVRSETPPVARRSRRRSASGWTWAAIDARRRLIQPVFLFELSGQIGLRQVAEVLVGQRVELVLETGREHPLDLVLPGLLLKPAVLQQLLGPADVLVVELDAHVAREAVAVGSGAGEADELGLGNGHALALEREVDRALLDDRVDVVAPRVVVDEDVHGNRVFLVEATRQAPDAARRLAVAGEEDAVVPAPELVLREAVPLGALLA